jgi:hypothetical protein
MTTLTNEQIIAELGWSRQAIQAVLGVTLHYFRPRMETAVHDSLPSHPHYVSKTFVISDDRVRGITETMGLTPVIWTEGWWVSSLTPRTSWAKMLDQLGNYPTGVISLQHDWYQGTVDLAVGYFLPAA